MTRDAARGQAGRRQCVHARQDDACSHHESSQGILPVLAVACVWGGPGWTCQSRQLPHVNRTRPKHGIECSYCESWQWDWRWRLLV